MTIHVEIVSQDRVVYGGDAEMVTLPGVEGEMGVLVGHAPLLTTLAFGVITVKGNENKVFAVSGGIAEVQPNLVTVLADAAEDVNEISVERAEEAKRRAEELLKNLPTHDTDDYLAIEAALRRSNLRIDVAKRFQHEKKYSPANNNPQ